MTYRVEIRPLLESLAASRTFKGSLDLPDTTVGSQVFHFATPVAFDVTLTNAGGGVVAQGTVTATVTTPCVRCLRDASLTVQADVEGFYVLPGHDDEIPEEQEFEHIAADLSIDLEPAIVQSLIVELPFAPVHDIDCKGICPVCGQDRNEALCDCVAPSVQSPFDALKDMKLPDE